MEDNNIEKYLRPGKYRASSNSFSNDLKLQFALNDIDERISEIEKRLFKVTKKSFTTRAQQMLILKHLGVLDKLDEYNISGKKRAKLLSVLLNADKDNIEGDLSNIHLPDSYLNTETNYKVVTKAFSDGGLKDIAEETDRILDELMKKQ